MARINIEDKLFSDIRFITLCELYGSQSEAFFDLYMFQKLAQRFYCGEILYSDIPINQYNKRFNKVLEAGFAEKRGDIVHYFDANIEFNWLVNQIIKSKKAAEKRNQKKLEQLNSPAGDPRVTRGLSLTPTLTPAHTLNKYEEVNDPLVHFKKPEFFTKLKDLSKKHGFHFGKQLNMILNRFDTFDDFTDWLNILVSGKKELFELNSEGKFSNSAKRYIVGAIARECSNE